MSIHKTFKSGFVSIIGRPNVGKSTLINSLIGEKITITSEKPQTTRNTIQCVHTTEDSQIVFIDTPGIVQKQNNKLGKYMEKSVSSAYSNVDAILYVVNPETYIGRTDQNIIDSLKNVKTPVFLVINKIDTITPNEILPIIDAYKAYPFKEIVPISALKGETNQLIETITRYLEEGPMYFPPDMITDQPEFQVASELIREKTLRYLEQEIPHGIAIEILQMKKREESDIVDLHATIFCEKESHKGIIIGKKGAMLKKIATDSRIDIENLLGSKINMQIRVKVKKDWRNSDFLLKNFGYQI